MLFTCIQVILGGMLYDRVLGRGIRKKYLPEPNPTKIEMCRDTSYLGVFDVAKSTYFMDLDVEYEDMCLADSAGMPIAIADTEKWTVGSFYALQPSRYKLYVMLKEIVYLLLCS